MGVAMGDVTVGLAVGAAVGGGAIVARGALDGGTGATAQRVAVSTALMARPREIQRDIRRLCLRLA